MRPFSSSAKLRQISERIATLSHLKSGQSAWIQVSEESTLLAGLIALELMKSGVDSLIVLKPSWLDSAFIAETKGERTPPCSKSRRDAFCRSDLFISIDSWHRPPSPRTIPLDRIRRIGRSIVEEDALMTSHSLRWLGLAYPCVELAKALKISVRSLERTIFDAILTNAEEMDSYGRFVSKLLARGREVAIRGPKGTNLSLRMSELPPFIESCEFASCANPISNGFNIPFGEVFGIPLPGTVNGILFCPLCLDPLSNMLVRNLEMSFKDGNLDLDDLHADEGQAAIKRTFVKLAKIDRTLLGFNGIMNACELGVGINSSLRKAIGYPLIDEKIRGTIHIGVGDNTAYSGKNRSTAHWDFVSEINISIS